MTIQATRAEPRPLPATNPPRMGVRLQWMVQIVLAVALIAGTVTASFAVPPVVGRSSPPDASIVLAALAVLTIIVVLLLRRGLESGPRATLLLPLPLYTLYLAAVILSGPTIGVVLASIVSLHHIVTDRGALHWERVTATLRGAAVAAAATLAAGVVYSMVARIENIGAYGLHARLIAGFAATIVILAGVSLSRILDHGASAAWSGAAWKVYLGSPAFRFQVLLLSVGPLLPLVEVLDDVEAELAWVLFLVPLYAIYYLALVSVRLQERTDELQRTVEALAAARERQAELAGYATLVTRAQEEERRRLARELHDDTAQALVALSRGIDALATRPVDPPLSSRDARFLEELGHLAKRTLDGIRRACQNLRPSVLDDLGLAAALESLVSSMVAQGMPCSYVQMGEPPPCAPEVEVTVYRIAQEALSNALRHAQATAVAVELSYTADTLLLVVRDNGAGFDAAQHQRGMRMAAGEDEPEDGSHLGLLGMRERAALIGARLDVASTPGRGTTVTLHAPLRAKGSRLALAN